MYPLRRNRRLRANASIRSLVRENSITPNDFLVPLFVVEGKGIKDEIPSMPNYYRFSLDTLQAEVKLLWSLGLKAVLLFVKVEDKLKDNRGTEALNPNGLMQRAIKTIKNTCPEMLVMTDVALDPYSIYGHDGIIENGKIVNDPTVDVLAQMSLSHAEAGANFVAPSDMMDGRILNIREALEDDGFIDIGIMSYSAKYASSFYGPFRDAAFSAPSFGDRGSHQMDIRSGYPEAILEAVTDEGEGADIIMIKPALTYLDVVRQVSDVVSRPVAVFNVSGEYSMVISATPDVDSRKKMVREIFHSFKRAGADVIVSYHTREAVSKNWL